VGRADSSQGDTVRLARLTALAAVLAAGALPASAAAAKPRCFGKPATIVVTGKSGHGTKGDDVIVVRRRAGAQVDGGLGTDRICGSPGRDRLDGGGDNDRIDGRAGRDALHGGPGADVLRRRAGDTVEDAGAGDRINGRRLRNVARLRPGVVRPAGARVVDPRHLTVAAGARVARGKTLVVPAGARNPTGAIGRVVSVRRSGRRQAVRLSPLPLDAAYSKLSVRTEGTVGELALSAASKSALKPKFDCKSASGAGPVIEVEADYSKLKFVAEVGNVYGPSLLVMFTGKVRYALNFAFKGQYTCRLKTGQAKIFIPVYGPLGVQIQPAYELTVAQGEFGGTFAWEPRVAYGFFRSRSSGNYDVKELNSEKTVEVYGTAGAELFLGTNIEVSGGGRVGVGGSFGPVASAKARLSSSGWCVSVDAAVRGQLTASADVFFKDWSFAIGTITSPAFELFERCGGGGGGTGGAPGSSPGAEASWNPGPAPAVSLAPGDPVCALSTMPRLSGDGRWLYYAECLSGIARVSLAGGGYGRLPAAPGDEVADPAWPFPNYRYPMAASRDGRYLLVSLERRVNNPSSPYTNFNHDVYRYDAVTEGWQRADVAGAGGTSEYPRAASGGRKPGGISADGRIGVFSTYAPLLSSDRDADIDSYGRDFTAGATERLTFPSCQSGGAGGVALSDDGLTAAFDRCSNSSAGTCNGPNVFVRDRAAGTTSRLTANCGSLLDMSSDGRFVLTSSYPIGGHGLELFDRATGAVAALGPTRTFVTDGAISDDGRYVAYADQPESSNVGPVYRIDRAANSRSRVDTVPQAGERCTYTSWPSFDLSSDGQTVAYAACGVPAGSQSGATRIYLARFG
jgi:hypothetical protein